MKEEFNNDDQENENGAQQIPTNHFKSNLYSKIKLELSEEDLKNPSLTKIILEENGKLKEQIESYKSYQVQYTNADKDLAVCKEKLNVHVNTEILHDFCLGVGGIIAGLSALDLTKTITINNYIFIIIGLLLVVGASISKWRK